MHGLRSRACARRRGRHWGGRCTTTSAVTFSCDAGRRPGTKPQRGGESTKLWEGLQRQLPSRCRESTWLLLRPQSNALLDCAIARPRDFSAVRVPSQPRDDLGAPSPVPISLQGSAAAGLAAPGRPRTHTCRPHGSLGVGREGTARGIEVGRQGCRRWVATCDSGGLQPEQSHSPRGLGERRCHIIAYRLASD
jgi:hypothetical protein